MSRRRNRTRERPASPFSGRTAWTRNLQTPLREFLRTETGGAAVMLAATVAALVWVNVDTSSYESLWETTLSIDLDGTGVALELRHWVNSGLMTSYLIVPLFALANAGIAIDGAFLERAFSSPLTLGILFGYVAGKPAGILGASWLLTRATRGRLRPPVGWAAVAAGGTTAGIGFTVSLLVATLAFDWPQLEEAKLGILSAALGATIVTWLLFRATALLPRRLRIRALLGTAEPLVDLYIDVDRERDHIRGAIDAPVTVVEHGDFECPYCGQAEPVVRELLGDFGDVRYVWRHLPLNDVHPRAQAAALAAEAASDQGAFWEMHDLLLDHQDALGPRDLIAYAEQLGLDVERFTTALREQAGAARVADDVDSADLSAVTGTPTFFINGRRHYGAYDIVALSAAVRAAGARASLTGAID